MSQLDTRIPLQVPNVLAQQAQISGMSAVDQSTRNNLATQFNNDMAAPLRRNALAQQGQSMNLDNVAGERQILGQALSQFEQIPEAQRAAMWPKFVGDLARQGVLDERLAQVDYSPEMLPEMWTMAAPPAAAELTDMQRNYRNLQHPDPRIREAAAIALQLLPSADARLRGQTGDKPTTAMQEYEFARQQGHFEGSFTDWKAAQKGGGVRVLPDGTVEIGGPQLGRAGENEIDKRTISTADSLARIQNIRSTSVDVPELFDMNTFAGNMRRMGLEWADYLSPESLNDDQRAYLEKVTVARADILENVNFTIQQMTGAAVGVDEEVRLRATIPDVADGPTQFLAKLNRVESRLTAAIARYNMWKAQGSVGEGPWEMETLGNVEKQMNKRLSDLNAAVEAQDITEAEANAVFASEFGL